MKVLVTGGAGFIGSHTVDALLERGHRVAVLDNLAPPVHEDDRVPAYVPLQHLEFIRGDVRDKSAWEKALRGADAVIHLAAYQDYLPNFSTFFDINTVGTALLYEVAVERRIPLQRVVVASSQAVYGEAKYRCPNVACPLTESTQSDLRFPPLRPEAQLRQGRWNVLCTACGVPLERLPTDEGVVNPHNQYAVSKYTQELVSLNLGRRYGIPTVCMRYSIVQGSRQSFRNAYSGILRIFTQRLLSKLAPVCYEDGGQLRDYVSVHDVARANMFVLEDARAAYEAFNVGGDREVTVADYARLLAARIGRNIEPETPGIYRFGDTRHVISDISKLRSLGWAPSVSLDEIAGEYIDWILSQDGFRDYSAEADALMLALGTLRRAEVA